MEQSQFTVNSNQMMPEASNVSPTTSGVTPIEAGGPYLWIEHGRIWLLPISGVGIFGAAEACISDSSPRHYWIMEVIYGCWLVFAPLLIVLFQRRWRTIHSKILNAVTFQVDQQSATVDLETRQTWLISTYKKIFCIKQPLPIAAIALSVVLGVGSLIPQPIAYGSQWLDALLLTIFGLVLMLAGYGAFLLASCLWFLVDFYQQVQGSALFAANSRAFRSFESAWLLMSSLIAGIYFLILAATVSSPYGLHGIFIIWMRAVAVLPLICLIMVFTVLRQIRVKVKTEQLDRIIGVLNQLVASENDLLDPGKVEAAASMAELLDRLQSVREWPISSLAGSSLFIGLAPVAGQVWAAHFH